MASSEQIRQAIQAAANLGTVSGFRQALEHTAVNIENAALNWDREGAATNKRSERSKLRLQSETARAIRAQLLEELNRRTQEETGAKQVAEASARLALSPSDGRWHTYLPNFGAGPWRELARAYLLKKLLGGAAPQKTTP